MYGKVFSQLYDSTMAAKGPWEVMALWPHMICLADKDGDVDMPAEILARKITFPLDVVLRGLEALSAPDPDSRSKLCEGRRIVLIDPDRQWGWHLVNYKQYAKIRSNEERKEYKKEWVKNKRQQLSTGVDSRQMSTLSTHIDVDIKPPTPLPAAPAGVRDDVWASWLKYRGKQKAETVRLQARRLNAWHLAGLDPNEIVERSIANGWKGLFPPDKAPAPSRERAREGLY